MIVVDANVLLYAHHQGASRHEQARSWLEESLSGKSSIGFAWSVITAFVRMGTNHRVFERPLTIAQATAIVDSWFSSPAAVMIHPGEQHWTIFQKLLTTGRATGNFVPDAHLAALTIEHGATLLSSDRDFTRFSELDFKPF